MLHNRQPNLITVSSSLDIFIRSEQCNKKVSSKVAQLLQQHVNSRQEKLSFSSLSSYTIIIKKYQDEEDDEENEREILIN